MPLELAQEKSELIAQKVINHSIYQKANLIFAYVDAKGEVQTGKIIEHAWSHGKIVAVPKVHGNIMKFYRISSWEDLESGCFGIMEPKQTYEELTEIEENSVVLMPGVAFDRCGNRIGYGRGYYDKYFTNYAKIYKIALAFSIQIVQNIPAELFDVKANCVITEENEMEVIENDERI